MRVLTRILGQSEFVNSIVDLWSRNAVVMKVARLNKVKNTQYSRHN